MWTLALETSSETGSVAIFKDQALCSHREWRREKSHSELLTANIDSCLAEAKVAAKSLSRIAVGVGPGSFTGIRIAVNAAKTFAYSVGCKIFASDSFRILAEPTKLQKLPIFGMLNAHKNLIYVASLEHRQHDSYFYTLNPSALSINDIEKQIRTPHLCVGSGYDLWKDLMSQNLRDLLVRDPIFDDEPLAAHLGRMASVASETDLISWQQLQPLYIRASEPEEKLKAGLFTDRSRINE